MKILYRPLLARGAIACFVLGSGLLTVIPFQPGWTQSRPHTSRVRKATKPPSASKATRVTAAPVYAVPAPLRAVPTPTREIQNMTPAPLVQRDVSSRPLVLNPPRGINRTPRRNGVEVVDPQAWALLTKMYRPNVEYEGVEVSNVNGMSSEETIQGDTKGRTRREYLSPGKLLGNIILTSPNQFYNYNKQENRLYLALWPVEAADKAARLRALARTGRVRIQITGEQMVAGRAAMQVTILAANGSGESEARRVLNLDKETGILLQMDRYNSASRLISSTYLRSITVGAALDPKLFNPASLPPSAERVPLFPEGQPMFTSVEQARAQVPFAIKEPTQLPAGYILDGVWVFGPKSARPSVLLRYSSGVNHFSVFENLVPANKTGPATLLRPSELRPRKTQFGWGWRVLIPEGQMNILYTGHLPETQESALLTSLQ